MVLDTSERVLDTPGWGVEHEDEARVDAMTSGVAQRCCQERLGCVCERERVRACTRERERETKRESERV